MGHTCRIQPLKNRPPLLPPTRDELDELEADLDAVGLLPGTGASRRVTSNGHRPAVT